MIAMPGQKLSDEQRVLAESAIDLAETLGRHWAKKCRGYQEDYLSEANWGLVLAARTHRPSRGAPFRVFARLVIRAAIFRMIRHDGRKCRHGAIELGDEDFKVLDYRNPCWRGAEASAWRAEVRDLTLRHLEGRQRDLIDAAYFDGLGSQAAGRAMGMPSATAARVHRQALARLVESGVAATLAGIS